jgi:hypothetical protein
MHKLESDMYGQTFNVYTASLNTFYEQYWEYIWKPYTTDIWKV